MVFFSLGLLSSVIIISVLALLFAGWLTRDVLKRDSGTPAMKEVANAIKIGAEAFVKRQYTTIAVLSAVLAVIIFVAYAFFAKNYALGWRTSVSFLFGAASSAFAGIFGMWISVRANSRTASAARTSMNDAFVTAFRGGAVTGIVIVAMSLLGVSIIYYLFSIGVHTKDVPFLIVGYGFGASFVALFAQLGGGIYTKAADVGSDLVGKVEKGIPEDDPRNPAVIADLVGDNVGDCAGRGADLFESTAAENIGAMILGVALYSQGFGIKGILFPLVVRAFGLITTTVGIMTVKLKNENDNPMTALNRGYYKTSFLAAVVFYFTTRWLLPGTGNWFFYSGLVGIATSILIVWITVYYTESNPFFFKNSPVKKIAKASLTGHATNIISGFAVAMEATVLPVVVLSFALILSFYFGKMSGVAHGGLYGTAIATMGMLSTAAYVLAMDNFGPITDNAGGIASMSKSSAEVRKRTDKLDAVGNTTKALTKGYAIGSAALAAFLLFTAYLDDVKAHLLKKGIVVASVTVDISRIHVFVGALIGAMLIFLFSAFAIKAVGDTAFSIVNEVRRQWKAKKGIMSGRDKPDYARVVDICVKASLKEMVLPGLLVVIVTVVVGVVLGYESVAAYLMVATITGILMALLLNTGGGAWDNAKKLIEEGEHGGKGSNAHKAAVTGDTIGDPFKDTAGPSLHVLIKLLSTITLVLVPLFV
ncbi:sodium-translocating pyrophosphatase [Candidatus Woesearchaeota archaeon]|nr:sodium-translocating pyrophosphatase [Candidatus Woesearchaeota archaeon]